MRTEVTTPMHAPTTTTTTATVDTAPVSVPAPPPPTSAALGRTGRLWVALAMVGGLLVTAVVVASFVEVPYYAFAPGSAVATEERVLVGGGQPSYDSAGEIYFLTVSLRPDETVLEAFWDWLDPDVDLVASERVLQGRTADENRAAQAAAMVGSKSEAVVVAFERLGLPLDPTGTGAVILDVSPGTPAEGAVEITDVITAVDGSPVLLDADLAELLGSRPPGTTVTLDIQSFEGVARQETVTLAARPDDPTRGFLGVTSDTRGFDPRPGFPIDIDQGDVGGPSAGLAFALAIIDVLTPGDLTGGRQIAVTGSIELDGTVTPVGGVAQKTAAAAAAGAEVLLVPAGEEGEAQRNDHGLEVLGVATIDDALAALERLGGEPLPPRGTPISPG